MMNIKSMLMLSVSCLTFMVAKDVRANVNYNFNSRESNLDTKHIYTHKHLDAKHLSSAYFSSPIAFSLRGVSIAPSDSNLSTSNFPLTTSLFSSPIAFSLRGVSIAPSGSNLSTSNFTLTASVCFITDTSACGGIGAASGEDNTGGGGAGTPDYELDPDKRCQKEGYLLKSCNSAQVPVNLCPYNDAIFEKCECKKDLVTCTKPQYGVGPVCGGKYVSCQTDNPRACKEDGYVNTCSSGQKLKKSPRCPYDSSYGICCTERCANNSSTTCTGANVGDDGCGYTCKQCCDDTCPSYTAKNYSGAYTSTTGCGNKCYKCNCPSGTAPNFSGAYAGSSECGSCYKCSDTCSKGATSVSCSSKYKRAIVASTQCGIPCYECQYNSDCDARSTSCSKPYGCSYNSCGICSSCSYNYDCDASSTSCSGNYKCDYNSCGICSSCYYQAPATQTTMTACSSNCWGYEDCLKVGGGNYNYNPYTDCTKYFGGTIVGSEGCIKTYLGSAYIDGRAYSVERLICKWG